MKASLPHVAHVCALSHLAVLIAGIIALVNTSLGAEEVAVALPQGVKAVWDISKAYRESTPTRERICINGLWHFQPADVKAGADATAVPADRWGYFKVPGCWPGITDYLQKDTQTVIAHPSWKDEKMSALSAAWYQREIAIPAEWAGRRITLATDYLNSDAVVYLDGAKAGELRFPGGELDITTICRPGTKQTLSMLVTALPLRGVLLSYTDSASARQVKGSVARRGLCGDVYLVSVPQTARITDAKIDTSVRRWEITFNTAVEGLPADAGRYSLDVRISDGGREVTRFKSDPFTPADLKDGHIAFTRPWKPDKLWDTISPENVYTAQVSLLDAAGKAVDTTWTDRFGFREFWIDGRDFYLNGSRIYLSALPVDNAQVGVAWSTYDAARETMRRLKSIGVNFVYTHNYDCEPGSHLAFTEILRAADDAGMLVSFSQPHFSHYDWKAPDADKSNGYATHARFYVGVAGNHPSIVCYSMSHNATGYNEDMNPDMIDGLQSSRDNWASNNVKLALRAEAVVRQLDPGRFVYHHASGNLSTMHAINFYANFAPIQEMSDWFGHWATAGVKPVFTCEYAVPFTWDWTTYRGWYKGQREFGSAAVPWELCLAEWNSQFQGDRAYDISENVKTDLRWESKQAQAGKLYHRWDYPVQVGAKNQDEYFPILAMYTTDNWRAFRTWGVSANSQWECGTYWRLRDGVDKGRKQLSVDWDNLQRPGFSPDYLDQRYEQMVLAYEQNDWVPTPAAAALLRNNQPLLAYMGGKASAFTSKDHNFRAGDTVEKQLIVINNSRQTVTADCTWSLAIQRPISGAQTITIPTGQQERIALRFPLPADLKPGQYTISASVRFSGGTNAKPISDTQTDTFTLDVMPPLAAPKTTSKIALFDPKGETTELLKSLSISAQPVEATSDLSGFDTLIIGKAALTPTGPAPDITRVRDGLKVLVFEQTSEALEKRLGFRAWEYGLRTVFRRVPDHPLLAGLSDENLANWAGSSTILPPQLKYEKDPRRGVSVKWCDLSVTRVWRCGNRGDVASVLIEKPACGDFLPIVDGGFALQYSPLMLYREGSGMIVFCQLDITGRSEPDPAAQAIAANIMRYVADWKPQPNAARQALYVGDPAGQAHLQAAGIAASSYAGGPIAANQVLIAGPGAGAKLAASPQDIAAFLKSGGRLLVIGENAQDANAYLPTKLSTKKAEHIGSYFAPFPADSPLAGISPADAYDREASELPLVTTTTDITAFGDGALAQANNSSIIFCQVSPWNFDDARTYHLKRTYRRASFLLTRLLANAQVAEPTPLLARFAAPVDTAKPEQRFLQGLYLDTPEEWDDPYRFFRW